MRPLVHPGPPLSAADALRFSRHTVLPQVGEVGQRRLRNARVCVVGAGGLGSPALLYLAAAGVGTLGVVDRDVVDVTNLQRQVLHTAGDVGRRKVDSAREAVHGLDPAVGVEVHHVDLHAGNVREVLRGYHLVLDGSDNFPTRYLVNDACADLGLPLVWGSVLGFHAQVSVFWSSPPEGEGVDLRDLFPEPPAPGEVPSCALAGVLGALCGQVGALMATEAIKLITGIGEPLIGRVAALDALTSRWREVPVRRSPVRGAPARLPGLTTDAASRSAAPGLAPDAPSMSRPAPVSARSAPLVGGEASIDPSAGTLTPADLAARLRSGEPIAVVDVREPHEFAAGSIPGAVLVPLGEVESAAAGAAIPRDVPVVLYCAGVARAEEARAILDEAGYPDAAVLEGGISAWWVHEVDHTEPVRA